MKHTAKPPITIHHESMAIYTQIRDSEIAILCGKNNCGKSYLLKTLYNELGTKTSFLGPNRYQNFNILSAVAGKRDKDQLYYEWIRQLNNDQHNIDNSPWNLQQAIAELGNDKRKLLFEILELLLGSKITLELSEPNNDMAQRFVSVDGYNISFTSSGFRLITSILTSLLDEDYENYLIDEPELGISPEVQGMLSDFLFSKANRTKYFPHLKKVIIATHSPLFIDRTSLTRNYHIERSLNEIKISQISSIQGVNSLQYFLLGNRFETLYLPSVIILVEGICDYKFISTLMNRKYPNSNFSVIQCNGDSKLSEYVHMAKTMFGDLQKSPYHNRILVIIDKVHTHGMKKKLLDLGIMEQNIIIWKENGIEYYYPSSIMDRIFGEMSEVTIQDDVVTGNGLSYKKGDLVNMVISHLSGSESYNEELESKLFKVLAALFY